MLHSLSPPIHHSCMFSPWYSYHPYCYICIYVQYLSVCALAHLLSRSAPRPPPLRTAVQLCGSRGTDGGSISGREAQKRGSGNLLIISETEGKLKASTCPLAFSQLDRRVGGANLVDRKERVFAFAAFADCYSNHPLSLASSDPPQSPLCSPSHSPASNIKPSRGRPLHMRWNRRVIFERGFVIYQQNVTGSRACGEIFNKTSVFSHSMRAGRSFKVLRLSKAAEIVQTLTRWLTPRHATTEHACTTHSSFWSTRWHQAQFSIMRVCVCLF